MNPANDVALNISLNSTSIGEVLTKNIWTDIKKIKEITIVNKILMINSAKDCMFKLKLFKNSIGKNNINKDKKNNIKPQKRLCPDQALIEFGE